MFYDRFTRFLHVFIAFGITAQLAVSLGMTHPKPDRPGDFLYGVHEYLGVALLGILVTHWIWSMIRGGRVSIGQFFPWLSKAGRTNLIADVRTYGAALFRLSLPDASEPSPLANAIQGLGLIVAMLLAASGTMIFAFAPEGARMPEWLHAIKEIHEWLGPLMWTYLAVHAGAGMLHQLAGHGAVSAMFRFWRRSPNA
ncbi:MAG: cytochrome b/b6 domain-containing protein [Rhodospirillales bacterium]|nr:cytochrome b/b6 domain-containing protein [Rhodospirillales bacterium]